MERKRNLLCLLPVCLLLWTGISVSVAQEMPETTVSATNDQTDSPTMAKNDELENTAPTATPLEHVSTDSIIAGINCHLYNCMGDHCYRNETLPENYANTTCPTYCATFRHNSSFYEKMCDKHCIHHLCNDSAQDGCTINCCNSSECLMSFNNVSDGSQQYSTNMPSTSVMTTASTTLSTTTTVTTIVYSEMKCRSFKCDGTDCYKTQTNAQAKQCQVGIKHCELQKIVKNGATSYEAGCSNTCSSSSKSCASITNGDCFQECCNATSNSCCMKLDGQVHFNAAPLVRKGSLLKIFTCVFFVIFISHFVSSSRV